jgi:dipeptidyl aminopeptidase/acylaminoacyl peptidase
VLDNIVPISQARQFHENLLKQNKQSHLIEIPFAGHNFDFPAHAPAGQIMLNSMYQFMVKYP